MSVKIASSDRKIRNKKPIALFPTLWIGGRIYVHPQLPFNPPHRLRLSLLGIIKKGMGIRWFDKPRKNNHRLVFTLKRPALPNIDVK